MAKRKSGKPLEKTIKLIEEVYNNSPDNQVFLNHTLICESGIEREFDVIVKSKVNDYDICIAFECKDYTSKVSIEKIEAFKSKCSTVKEINKMVFVSAFGYQRGAITQAKNFGIKLLTAEQVSTEYLNDLIPNFSHFKLEITKKNLEHLITLGSNESIDIEESRRDYKNEVIDYSTGIKYHITELMKKTFDASSQFINEQSLKHYVTHIRTIEQNPSMNLMLGINIPPTTFYFEDKNLKKIDLIKLEFPIEINFNKKIKPKSGRVIKNSDNSIKAHSILFKIDENTESEMILKPDNNFTFFHTINKETVEFKTLASYDPKSNKITSP